MDFNEEIFPFVLLAIVWFIIFVYWVKVYREKKFSRWLSDNYFRNLCESIHILNAKAIELEQVEKMVEDIQRNDGSIEQDFRITVPETLSSVMNEANLRISDLADSQVFLDLLVPHRDKLRSSLFSDLDSVLRIGVTQTYANEMERKFTRFGGGEPENPWDVEYIHYKTGAHFRDGSDSHPHGNYNHTLEKFDFDSPQYKALSRSYWRKAHEGGVKNE